jgi:hypothetical protein
MINSCCSKEESIKDFCILVVKVVLPFLVVLELIDHTFAAVELSFLGFATLLEIQYYILDLIYKK